MPNSTPIKIERKSIAHRAFYRILTRCDDQFLHFVSPPEEDCIQVVVETARARHRVTYKMIKHEEIREI